MIDFRGLNLWAWFLLGLYALNFILVAFLWGKPRTPYGGSTLIGAIIGLALVVLALGMVK